MGFDPFTLLEWIALFAKDAVHKIPVPVKRVQPGGWEQEEGASRDFPLRDAGMDCRHPDSLDASGDIHVGLGSSGQCWSDKMG
jgi:hypothetical protein